MLVGVVVEEEEQRQESSLADRIRGVDTTVERVTPENSHLRSRDARMFMTRVVRD